MQLALDSVSEELSKKPLCKAQRLFICGAAYWNRTSDPQLRRLLLYPTELTPPRKGEQLPHMCSNCESSDHTVLEAH